MALTHRRRPPALLTLPIVALLTLSAAPADAWHEPERPVTDYSAATLDGGEWRLYLGTLLEYGVVDGLEVGTMPLLYVVRTPNLTAKWNFISGDNLSMAASAGFVTTNPRYFREDAADVQLYIVPVALYGSWRSSGGDIGLHAGLHYTTVGTTGAVDLKEAFGLDFAGNLRGSTLKLAPVAEFRTSRSFAWVVEGSISLSQAAEADFSTTVTSQDGRTTVEVFADGSVSGGNTLLGNVSVSAYWSWGSFNLRLGLGYGHAELPMLGLFADSLWPLPKFNAYWRF